MSFESSEDLLAALRVHGEEVDKAVAETEKQIQDLNTSSSQLREARSSIAALPSKLRVPILVPLGKHAFFPGHLVHTNELKVHIGAEYYVDATAAGASGILQRRHQVVHEAITKATERKRALTAPPELPTLSLQELLTEEGLKLMEIRESVEDSDALLASAAGAKQAVIAPATSSSEPKRAYTEEEYAKLQQRFAELALLEAQAEAARESDDAGPGPAAHHLDPATSAGEPAMQAKHTALPVVLEEPFEPDSDDESDYVDGGHKPGVSLEGPVSSHPQQSAVPMASSSSGKGDTGSSQPSSSSSGGRSGPSASTDGALTFAGETPEQAAAATASTRVKGSKPVKPALKKGFLLGSGGSNKGSQRPGAAPKHAEDSTRASGGTPEVPKQVSGPPEQEDAVVHAFTGQVVERVVDEPGSSSSSSRSHPATAVVERTPQGGLQAHATPHSASPADAAAPRKPISKFLQQRRGLI
jgi:unconventional prefoldin RPB5 interactor 1